MSTWLPIALTVAAGILLLRSLVWLLDNWGDNDE